MCTYVHRVCVCVRVSVYVYLYVHIQMRGEDMRGEEGGEEEVEKEKE